MLDSVSARIQGPFVHPGLQIFGEEEPWHLACVSGQWYCSATTGTGKPAGSSSANEITGLPRDNFEVWEITKEEFEGFRRE